MEPAEILEKTRDMITEHAGDDSDKWFYANRFVYARLQLDERKTKTGVKQRLFDSDPSCSYCEEKFEAKKGVHLHRVDEERGYSDGNCSLMHAECHTTYHSENPKQRTGTGDPKMTTKLEAGAVKKKKSMYYEGGSFSYWWDITPSLRSSLHLYDSVEFIKKDSLESCLVSREKLKGFLTPARQTTRGDGNWGIKVLRDEPDKLAFEPGPGGEWLYLPVTWENQEKED